MLSFLMFLSPLELHVGNSSWKFNFQARRGTWIADRTTVIPNRHAGRLDPAASHRPGPTAGPGQPAGSTPSTNLSNLRTHLKIPREGLATNPADRAAGLAGGHAGRLDPAASHRPVPTAGPGQLAGSTPSTNFSNLRTHLQIPREGLATNPADRAAGLAGGHAGRLDPAASHRPGPTAGPGQPAGSTPSTNLTAAATCAPT